MKTQLKLTRTNGKLLLTFLVFTLFSCEKDNSGYGNYIIKISNYTSTNQNYYVYLDNTFQGQLFADANTSVGASYCKDLVAGAQANNVKILTYVSSGTHTIKLTNSVSEATAYSGEFKMTNDGCIEQPLIIE